MPTQYTTLLGLAKPVTGELPGTWGATVNSYLTDYIDSAVAGAQVISGSQTAVTLSTTNGSSLVQAGVTSSGSSQYAIIRCTGNPAGLLTITAPAASKAYLIINATSTSQSVKLVGAGPTTGVTVAASRAALVAWNGSDFALIATTDVSQLSGTLAVANGGTGAASLTANNVILGNGTSAVQVVAPSTNGNVLTSDGTTWASAAKVTVDTIQTTTSGTTKTFTGIPPTAKVIHVMFNRVRITLAQSLIVRVGSASGVVTSSYRAAWSRITNTAAASNSTTSGIDIPIPAMGSSQYVDGFITLCLFDTSNFQWSVSGVVGANVGLNTIMAMISGFTPALPSALDRIEISALGGATFDLGSVNISYF